jgi:hypothetical protein
MLQLFRNIFKSKLGVGLTLAFLLLIAIAFASSDVANNRHLRRGLGRRPRGRGRRRADRRRELRRNAGNCSTRCARPARR